VKIETLSDRLRVCEVAEISGHTADSFRNQVRSALTDTHKVVEIDLGDTQYLDSTGLGALISLLNTVRPRNGAVRLLNPNQNVQTILNLTRLHRVFEVHCARSQASASEDSRGF